MITDPLSAVQKTAERGFSAKTETAHILRNATKNSLIILDEIGRGTSTFDGLSIAWAVVEYIADKEKIGAKTMFATHYHELSELEGHLEGVKNFCISVKEHGEDVLFLRRIVRGGADKSFGVHVARLAGIPRPVIVRAHEIQARLEVVFLTDGMKHSGLKHGWRLSVNAELILPSMQTGKGTKMKFFLGIILTAE